MCSILGNVFDLLEMSVLELAAFDSRPAMCIPAANDDCEGVQGRCSRCGGRTPIHLNGFGCLMTFTCGASGSCKTATGGAVDARLLGGSGWLVGGCGWYPYMLVVAGLRGELFAADVDGMLAMLGGGMRCCDGESLTCPVVRIAMFWRCLGTRWGAFVASFLVLLASRRFKYLRLAWDLARLTEPLSAPPSRPFAAARARISFAASFRSSACTRQITTCIRRNHTSDNSHAMQFNRNFNHTFESAKQRRPLNGIRQLIPGGSAEKQTRQDKAKPRLEMGFWVTTSLTYNTRHLRYSVHRPLHNHPELMGTADTPYDAHDVSYNIQCWDTYFWTYCIFT